MQQKTTVGKLRRIIREVLTSCPKCGGKGELDFGFYQRPCEKCEGQGEIDDGLSTPEIKTTTGNVPTCDVATAIMGGKHDAAFTKIATSNGFEWTLYGQAASAGRWFPGFRDKNTGELVLYHDGSVRRSGDGSELNMPAVDEQRFNLELDEYLAVERRFFGQTLIRVKLPSSSLRHLTASFMS